MRAPLGAPRSGLQGSVQAFAVAGACIGHRGSSCYGKVRPFLQIAFQR